MKKKNEQQKTPQQLKRKLMATLSMLLIATILMTTTSYAWLVLSVAPEVTGITTNVGANGALEIALLNTTTRNNLNAIRTVVGESLAGRNPAANNSWGNLIDLSYADYGLNDILLLPSRLKVNANAEGYSVAPNLLSVPSYGYDGRIIKLNDETMSATYTNQEFSLMVGQQEYGVRAIGTTDTMSVQATALALAKSNITTYTNSAKSATNSVLSNNGDTLFNIVLSHFANPDGNFTDTELSALKDVLNNLQTVLNYNDLALRQGIVAVAASKISGKDLFTQVRDRVMDTTQSLGSLLGNLEEVGQIPDEFQTWVDALEETQNSLNVAKNSANALSGGAYTWDQLREILDYIMNVDYVMINGEWFGDFDKSSAGSLIGGNVNMTLAPGSGIFADIATFIGNFSSVMTLAGTTVEIATAIDVDVPYMNALAVAVRDLEAADSSGEAQEAVALNATYGYALDLAFRCNAANSELLLQTTPEHRVYEGNATGAAMGGGSYMEFSTKDSDFTLAKMYELMDSIRVAFVDDQSNILGIAKLNTSNRTVVDGVVKAPLYLYDFGISEEDGSILMGERRLLDNTIVGMTQNEPKAITAIVWLDGDIVDNTMVSATESASLNGVLNLQFASSANLIPANNTELLNITADKTDLNTLLLDNQEKFEAGQGTYTTVSWNSFLSAYNYANAVYENPNANDNQVYTAALNLTVASGALENVSHGALNTKIDEIRDLVGESGDIARYVVKNEDDSYAVMGHEEYTQKEYDGWTKVGEINQVDYTNNLHDEGNDIHTQIYTDESWSALASALYSAEATVMNDKATDGQINAALTALETAHKALQRRVFYKPYDYNGRIYYEAICNANDADTYGKWYDSDFKRIVADITILNLDAYAEPVDIAELVQDEYVAWNVGRITPYVNILSRIYPELAKEEILGTNWSLFDEVYFREVMDQRHINTLTALINIAKDEKLGLDAAVAAAEALLNSNEEVSAANARTAIEMLSNAVTQALEERQAAEDEKDNTMTPSQQILLTTAINTARTVDGYNDPTRVELDALRTAVADAEAVLALEKPTEEMAENSLGAVNAALKALKMEEVTEYNTLAQTIPVTTEIYDVVYAVEYPTVSLALTRKTGKTVINVVVLTKNGVLFTDSRSITIYTPADRVVISEAGLPSNALNLKVGEIKDISAVLDYIADTHDGLEETLGNVTITAETITVAVPENAAKYTWASKNTNVASVTEGSNGSCIITAKSAGTTTVTVSIETKEGNVYTARLTVTVSE